ncbi:MAG: response regulator transcription factor [Campylobacterales bacterium]|nr:response regulator transcription factor [Campylobacterales bacterium]
MKKNILIVEDEESIVKIINNRLESNFYDVDVAFDGKDALSKISQKNYDLITLDIMLPYIDGFEICKNIRKKSKQTLVVMISAMGTEEFKTKGYEYGCDDYISKPFSAKELAIKIKSLLKRRTELSNLTSKNISNFILIKDMKTIKVNEQELLLTPSEYLILSTIILNSNRIFSRAEFTQLIYDNYLGEIDDRGIDSHIYHIRKKIKQYEPKELIKTVRGMGYTIHEN